MKTLEYTLRFVTPAFLGDAEQVGAWRTPPIKSLLRQWWRVAYAAEASFDVKVDTMRIAEGRLFGHAGAAGDTDDDGASVNARRSAVRIRLMEPDNALAWAKGTQRGVSPLDTGLPTSYACFGLIERGKGLPDRSGLRTSGTEAERQLALAVPDEHAPAIQEAIDLMHAFGVLGSRSRGGWGALHILQARNLAAAEMCRYARPLATCLQDDWAMSLATDGKGLLCWESNRTFSTWDDAMKFVAIKRKQVRTALKKDLRPALGFAGSNGQRMPSPLRWKVMAPKPRELVVRAFALPHAIPDSAGGRLSSNDLQSAWNLACRTMDEQSPRHMTRTHR